MTEIAEKLEKLFPTEEVRKRFITMAILEFQLSVDDLESLLGIDKKNLYDEFASYNGNVSPIVWHNFEFNHELPGVAKERFLTYLNRLQRAIRYGNEKLAKSILEELYDKEIVKFKQTHKPGDPIADEEILAIVKYQIKYSLSTTKLGEILGINRNSYAKRLQKILVNYPELERKYELLVNRQSAFHRECSKK